MNSIRLKFNCISKLVYRVVFFFLTLIFYTSNPIFATDYNSTNGQMYFVGSHYALGTNTYYVSSDLSSLNLNYEVASTIGGIEKVRIHTWIENADVVNYIGNQYTNLGHQNASRTNNYWWNYTIVSTDSYSSWVLDFSKYSMGTDVIKDMYFGIGNYSQNHNYLVKVIKYKVVKFDFKSTVDDSYCLYDGTQNLTNWLEYYVSGKMSFSVVSGGPSNMVSGTSFYPSRATSQDVIIRATFTPDKGASVSRTISISVQGNTVDAGGVQTVCSYDGEIDLDGYPSGGSWYNNTLSTNINSNYDISGINAGEHELVYTVSINGCSFSDTKNLRIVDVGIEATIDAPNGAICYGNSSYLDVDFSSSYTVGTTEFKWSPNAGLSDREAQNPLVTPLTNTVYEVEVKNSNCKFYSDVSVTVVTTASGGVTDNSVEVCRGESVQIEAFGGTSYSWTPTLNISNQNSAEATVSPTSDRTYTVDIEFAGGCYKSYEVDVNVLDLPSVSFYQDGNYISSGHLDYCQSNDFVVVATGGSSFEWSPASGMDNPFTYNPTFSISGDQQYDVEVTDNKGCSSSGSIQFNETIVGTTTISADKTEICGGEDVQLTVTGGSQYLWSPSNSVSNITSSSPVVTPYETTTYTVEISNGGICSKTEQITILVQNIGTAGVIESEVEICVGDAKKLEAFGGIAYSWSPNVDITGSSSASPTVNPTVDTEYFVDITFSNGCVDRRSVLVDVLDLPEIRLFNEGSYIPDNSTIQYCEGSDLDMTAVGGSSYEWSPIIGLDNPFVNNPTFNLNGDISYSVAVTNSDGCSDSYTVNFEENSIGVGDIVASSTNICKYESVQLDITGGTRYEWSPVSGLSSSNSANPIATPLESTTYSVEVFDDVAGCSISKSVTIIVQDIVGTGVTDEDVSICLGESVVLESFGGTVYNWTPKIDIVDDGTSTPTVSPTENRMYEVEIVNINGCSAFHTVEVDVTDLGTTRVSTNGFVSLNPTVCEYSDVQLEANNAYAISYEWSPQLGLSDPFISDPILSIGSIDVVYTVEVMDINGCRSQTSISFDVEDITDVDAGDVLELCLNSDAYDLRQDVSLIGGEFDSESGGLDGVLFYAADAGVGIHFIEYTVDIGSCVAFDTREVRVYDVPNAEAGIDIEICQGSSVQLTASGGSDYSWYPLTDISNANVYNPVVSPKFTTDYYVTVKNVNGCVDVDKVRITVDVVDAFAGENLTICKGESVELEGSGGSYYEWSPTDGLNDATIQKPVTSVENTTEYTLTVTNSSGCVGEDNVTVNVTNPGSLVITDPVELCSDLGIQDLRDFVNFEEVVFDGEGVVNDVLIDTEELEPGLIYFIDLEAYELGCTLQGTMEIEILSDMSVYVPDSYTVCAGESVQLLAEGGVFYEWDNANTLDDFTSDVPIASPTRSINYSVIVTDTRGCSTTRNVYVEVKELDAVVSVNQQICYGESVQLDAYLEGDGITYEWSPNINIDNNFSSEPVVNPLVNTEYSVRITDVDGCYVDHSVSVTVKDPLDLFDTNHYIELCQEYGNYDLRNNTLYSNVEFDGDGVDNVLLDTESLDKGGIYFINGTYTLSGCVYEDILEVRIFDDAVVNTSETKTICPGESVSIFAVGGQSYNWINAETLSENNVGSPIASPLNTTEYAVEITDYNGCTVMAYTTVEVKDLDLEISDSHNICYGEESILEVSIDGVGNRYTWSPNLNIDNVNSASPTVFPSESTEYTVVAVDQDGCSVTGSVFVSVQGNGESLELDGPVSVCKDYGLLDLRSFSNVEAEFSGTGVSGVQLDTESLEYGEIYFIDVEADISGCLYFDRLEVRVYDETQVSIVESNEICSGEKIRLYADGGLTYLWNAIDPSTIENNTSNQPFVSPFEDMMYHVTITDEFNCNYDMSTEVNIKEVDLELSDDAIICYGEVANIDADVSGSISSIFWSPGTGLDNTTIPNPLAGPDETTDYQVLVVDNDNCAAEGSVRVTVRLVDDFDVGDVISKCESDAMFDLRDVTGDLVVDISGPGVTGVTMNPGELDPGIYFVDYTKTEESCSKTISREVNVIATPEPSILNDNPSYVCPDDSIRLFGSGGASYYWTSSDNSEFYVVQNPFVKPLIDTYYTLEVFDTDSICSTSTSIEVRIDNDNTEAGSNFDICVFANPVELESPVDGGTWEGIGIINGVFDPTSAIVGDNMAYYSIINDRGCIAVDSINITVLEEPELTIGDRRELCGSDTPINLKNDANILGGVFTGEGVDGIFFDPSEKSGSYFIEYTLDYNGCEIKSYREIFVHEEEVITFGSNLELCVDASPYNLLDDISKNGGIFSGEGVEGNFFYASRLEQNNYEVTYTYENAYGCITDVKKIISVVSEVEIDAGPNLSICNSANSVDLNLGAVPNGGVYIHTAVEDNKFDATGLRAGAYIVDYYYENGNGCVSYDSLIVTVSESDISNFGIDTIVCMGSTPLELNFTSDLKTGYWEGAGIINNYFYTNLAGEGKHILKYKNDNLDCDVAGSREITVVGLPEHAYATNSEFNGCIGDYIELVAELPDTSVSASRIGWYKEDKILTDSVLAYGSVLNYEVIGDENLYYKSISRFGCPSDQESFIRINTDNPTGAIVTNLDSVEVASAVIFDIDNISNVENIYWLFGDGLDSYEKRAVHYYYEAGEKTISAVLTNSSNCDTELILDNFIVWEEHVDILSLATDLKYTIYPNPLVGGQLFFEGIEISDDLMLKDVTGKSVDYDVVEISANRRVIEIPKVSGLFFVVINNEFTYKIVVQ